jgi:hypothetical protein
MPAAAAGKSELFLKGAAVALLFLLVAEGCLVSLGGLSGGPSDAGAESHDGTTREEASETRDASADASRVPDSGSRPDTSLDAEAAGYCATLASSTMPPWFCADFDEVPFSAGWAQVTVTMDRGSLDADTAIHLSPPCSLLAATLAEGDSGIDYAVSYLDKILPTGTTEFTLALDLWISMPLPPDVAIVNLFPRGLDYSVSVITRGNAGLLTGEVQELATGDGGHDYNFLPFTASLTPASWQRITLRWVFAPPDGGSPSVLATLGEGADAAVVLMNPLKLVPALEDPTFEIQVGAGETATKAATMSNIDNVVIDLTP